MREAEQVEGPGASFAATLIRWSASGALEFDEPRLLRMQRQAVLRETVRKDVHEATSVILTREDHDEVVREADEMRVAFQPRHHLLRKPRVEHLVQVNVRQKRRDDTALRRAGVRMHQRTGLHHACIQPLANESEQHAVAYPLLKNFPELRMIEGVEESRDVDLRNPPALHVHRLVPQRVQRLMRRAPRPEAVRAVHEVLLVDGVQRHHDRTLQDLVLEGGDTDGPRLRPIALRDVDPPHGRRDVHAGLRAVEKRLEIGLQIRLVLGRSLSVDARRAVLPSARVRFAKPVEIDVMRERCDRRPRHLLRQCRYPIKFR